MKRLFFLDSRYLEKCAIIFASGQNEYPASLGTQYLQVKSGDINYDIRKW